MDASVKTKEQLTREVDELRQRIRELEAPEAERKHAQTMEAVARDISRLFLASRTLDDVYAEVPRILGARLGFPIAAIELYDAENAEMVFRGAVGIPPDEWQRPLRVPVTETISGTVATTGEAVCEVDAGARPEYRFRALRELNVVTFLCVPMKRGEQVIGTLALADRSRRPEAESIMGVLEVVANHLTQEVARKRAEEALRESEDRYSALFTGITDAVFVHHITSIGITPRSRPGPRSKEGYDAAAAYGVNTISPKRFRFST